MAIAAPGRTPAAGAARPDPRRGTRRAANRRLARCPPSLTAVPVLGAAAAIAACAAIAFGLWGAAASRDRDDTRAALEQAQSAAAVLSDPNARTIELEAGDGRLVVGEDGEAVLVLDALGPAPAGKTYEVWVSDGGAPVRAGLFDGAHDRDVVPVEETVDPGSVVAVTVEDAGGVDAPTSQPIVASQRA